MDISKKEKKLQFLREVRSDLKLFSKRCLKIRTKEDEVVPFVFNTAQEYLHMRLEEQLKRTGKVRALVLKGRQQGISTYVGARYYHKSSLKKAVNVYILAHEQRASDNLFEMVERYQSNNPIPPHVDTHNAKELGFDKLGSKYVVATAGKKAGGRSRTSSLFHGSEVAFWMNAKNHFAASVQSVPDLPGTEIILESTANGPGGEFYERWQDAQADDSDFEAIFIPWFWQEEYYREPPPGFKLSNEAGVEGEITEEEYAELFGLNDGQMLWRRAKIKELRSVAIFDQEYPATSEMAFVNFDVESYISPLQVLRARKRKIEGSGPLIMGADPAGPGGDRFVIWGRRGFDTEFLEWRNKVDIQEAYEWCRTVILEEKPARFFIDTGGIGINVYSLLKNDDEIPKGVVRGVNFGAKSQAKQAKPDKPGPKNRRAEMWTRMKNYIENKEEPCSIPDLDAVQSDLTGPQLKRAVNGSNDIMLESKDDMRARGVRSPDFGDAFALTFASTAFIKHYVDKKKTKTHYAEVDKRARMEPTPVAGGRNSWMG